MSAQYAFASGSETGSEEHRIVDRGLAHFYAIEDDHLYEWLKYWTEQVDLARARAISADSERDSVRLQAERFAETARGLSQDIGKFKSQVREVAIRVADEQEWCRDGLNSVLDELGLDEFNPRKRIQFTVTVLVEGESDDDEAESVAQSHLENAYSENVTVEEVDHRRTWDADSD